ncbi:hypothetical protein TEQG_08332 [Trichophyton equinum CBS 127.97]|uniref:Uncharacterized protein n=1 Tax=Trichophyton equinum (strain ATCC MYA-4606 / CBS 127.97) TaxID=559882 RepID=F2Q5D8_TRIEC|nr:hypothetical protein TEQG_08332 [Trichophyton equinum CBS 127.97]
MSDSRGMLLRDGAKAAATSGLPAAGNIQQAKYSQLARAVLTSAGLLVQLIYEVLKGQLLGRTKTRDQKLCHDTKQDRSFKQRKKQQKNNKNKKNRMHCHLEELMGQSEAAASRKSRQ